MQLYVHMYVHTYVRTYYVSRRAYVRKTSRVYTSLVLAMSDGTCAKKRDANKKPMRENTDSEIFYEKYTLSEETATRLDSIRKRMKENIAQANPMWNMIAGEVRITYNKFLISPCSLYTNYNF